MIVWKEAINLIEKKYAALFCCKVKYPIALRLALNGILSIIFWMVESKIYYFVMDDSEITVVLGEERSADVYARSNDWKRRIYLFLYLCKAYWLSTITSYINRLRNSNQVCIVPDHFRAIPQILGSSSKERSWCLCMELESCERARSLRMVRLHQKRPLNNINHD